MKKGIIIIFIISGLVLFVLYRLVYERGKTVGFEQGRLQGYTKGVQFSWDQVMVEPVTERPFFIFKKRKLLWKDIAGNIDKVFKTHQKYLKFDIVGTFPVPGNYKGSDNSEITWDQKKIVFPKSGEYYLRTTIGNLKILILDKDQSTEQEILTISSFVSKNTVHSISDGSITFLNELNRTRFDPEIWLRKFFFSDQPLCLHCGHNVRFLNYVLLKNGYKVRVAGLQKPDKTDGHALSEVFSPENNKWVMIDPDYGAIVRNEHGKWLSMKEISKMINDNLVSQLYITKLCNKKKIKAVYNLDTPFMFSFAWTIDKMSDKDSIEEENYLKVMGYIYVKYH